MAIAPFCQYIELTFRKINTLPENIMDRTVGRPSMKEVPDHGILCVMALTF